MKRIIVAAILLCSTTASADYPPNNEWIPPITDIMSNSVAKKTFDNTLDQFEAYAAPLVKAKGATLEVRRMWNDGTVNADTWKEGNKWIIRAYGGFARYPGMNSNAFLMVMCHELGHHMGGSPLYAGSDMSGEGQSDYWSTLKCFKDIRPGNILLAAQTLTNALATLSGEANPSIDTPDATIVTKTDNSHPNAQCRLDTLYNASQCNATGNTSPDDPRTGTCHNYDDSGSPIGVGNRPRCWYSPA